MARKKKDTRVEDLLTESRQRIDDGLALDSHNRDAAYDDLRMKVGLDHWKDGETDFKQERREAGRPTIEFNRLPGLSSQVIGDLRENRPSCKVHPADSQASIDFATYYEGRIRQIEADCDADAIYDTGAQQAADGGFGNWRIVTDYITDKSFDQTAKLESIENQFAVIWDPLSQKWDKTDANWVAVLTRISKEDYKRKYKGKDPSNYEISRGGTNWYLDNAYRICEYFRKEEGEKKKLYLIPGEDARISDAATAMAWSRIKLVFPYLLDQTVEELPPDIEVIWPVLLEEGWGRERTINKQKIVRYLLSGHEILEDAQEWVSDKYWPIVPIDGKITNVDGEIYRKSVIRDAKGAQKAYNFAWNTTLEDVALSPKAYYWSTPAQAKGFINQWKKAHRSLEPYRLYNPDPQAPGSPQMATKVQVNTAISEIAMRAVDDMRAMTNVFDPSMMQLQPDISGVAAKTRVSRAGVANFEFIDNVGRSIGLTWRILLDILPKIEDTKREVPVRDINGATKFEKINWPNESMKEGEPATLLELSKAGNYNVTVTVGPSYPTQRLEAVDQLTKIATAMPNIYPYVADEIVRNMDYPGSQKMRYRIMASMVTQGMAWIFTEEELKELISQYPQIQQMLQPQAQPPDPLTVAVMQKEWAQGMKAVAEAMKKISETKLIDTQAIQNIAGMLEQKAEEVGGGGQEQTTTKTPNTQKQ